MNFILNYIIPMLVGIAFVAFLLFQIFHKPKKKIRPFKKDNLYFSHNSNFGTCEDEEFGIIMKGKVKPNYLGHKSKRV